MRLAPSIMIMVTVVFTIVSCKSRESQRSELWSTTTAAAFGDLVTKGRLVAPRSAEDTTTKYAPAALSSAVMFSGVRPVSLEMDTAGNAILHATFNTSSSPSIPKTTDLAIGAQSLAFANTQVLGINPLELVLGAQMSSVGNVRWHTVRFHRVISGIPVRDAALDLIFVEQNSVWRLAEVSNRGWGRTAEVGETQSKSLTAAQLASVTGVANLKIVASGVTYLAKSDVNAKKITLNRANWYEVKGDNHARYTLTFSGAENPELLEAYSHSYEATVNTEVFQRSWSSAKINAAVPDATVVIAGGSQKLDPQGNANGDPTGGTLKLQSSWATLSTESGVSPQFPIIQKNGVATADTSKGHGPELNAYVTLARIRQFTQQFLSNSDTGYFDQRLAVTSQLSGHCNSYYQDATLNLFSAGNGCGDMTTVNDVVMHEWAHGLDDYTGPGSNGGGGITDAAFSEAIGDVTSMMYTGDNKLGVGFFTANPDKELRNLNNKRVYNPNLEPAEIHIQGTIVGGAFWEMRRRLVNKYSEVEGGKKAAKLFFQHLKEADSYLASYDIVQRLADDDGNPATKSADFCLINHAFAVKGLAKSDPCTDDFDTGSSTPTTPSTNSDLKLHILSETTNGVQFEASSASTMIETIDLCSGQGCTNTEISLTLIGPRADRQIYSSLGVMPLTSGKVIRMIGKNKSGAVVDSVHVRFVTK